MKKYKSLMRERDAKTIKDQEDYIQILYKIVQAQKEQIEIQNRIIEAQSDQIILLRTLCDK